MKIIKFVNAKIKKQNKTDITEPEFDVVTMELIRLIEKFGMNIEFYVVLEDEDEE